MNSKDSRRFHVHDSPKQSNQEKDHLYLLEFNRARLNPSVPTPAWRQELAEHARALLLEGELFLLEQENAQNWIKETPRDPAEFMEWFKNLRNTGPGQKDPLFPWLAEQANLEQMKYFLYQEVAGEAGFEDLTALAQVKMPTRPKLEMARNFWDEMGRGNEKGMHGPMLAQLVVELKLKELSYPLLPETIALANWMSCMAANKRFAYHAIGALGVIELTAPDRARCVYQGLKRLKVSSEGQRYYLVHSTLDVKHSLAWNEEVIAPLVFESPEFIPHIAEGAVIRLNAGARCFQRYRQSFWENENYPPPGRAKGDSDGAE